MNELKPSSTGKIEINRGGDDNVKIEHQFEQEYEVEENIFLPKNETFSEENYQEISIKEEPLFNEREKSSIYVEDVNLLPSISNFTGKTLKFKLNKVNKHMNITLKCEFCDYTSVQK